jgi:glycosyltransferase involved in cell wall biosynthesis
VSNSTQFRAESESLYLLVAALDTIEFKGRRTPSDSWGEIMAKTKALCVFTNVLGNATMTRTLVSAIDRLPGIDPTYVTLDGDDFANYPAPWWARFTNPWQAQFVVRKKTQAERKRQFDILWVHGWENAVVFRDLAERIPAVVTMDSVPATMDRQIRLRGGGSWKRAVAHQIHHRTFRAAASKFDCWLPWTSECAASLQHDYGVDPARCLVTLLPQDIDWWAPPARSFAPPWRALFVGNDFERKGGEFLLRLYTGYLAGLCTLTIVSNDAALARRQLPAGVQWIRGATKEQLRDAYWNSHMFLLPTLQDYGPMVIAEALAAGLPSIATHVGGVPDLIQNGESGYILPREASLDQWGERIHSLFADPEALRRMSLRARRFAEESLSLERFGRLVSNVIERLRAAA